MNPYEAPGTPSHDPAQPPAPRSPDMDPVDDAVSTVIPYKNAPALIAYYLGLFSCFPVLGFPMAIVALVLGVKGLRKVGREPQSHGTAHAWIGLVCGTIGLLINGLIIAALIAALVMSATKR